MGCGNNFYPYGGNYGYNSNAFYGGGRGNCNPCCNNNGLGFGAGLIAGIAINALRNPFFGGFGSW
jgi:hypothetical protein